MLPIAKGGNKTNEFKGVGETLKTRLSESTLGKQLSGIKIFDLDDKTDRLLQEASQEDAKVGSPENNRSGAGTSESDAQTDNAEKRTRELTEEERRELRDKPRWSGKKLNKRTVDEDGVIHYKVGRSGLGGETSENSIPYERKITEINGVKVKGVFPKFDSAFDTALDPDDLKAKAYVKECSVKLKEAIENDPELRSKFTKEQSKDIGEGRAPMGYVWHYNEGPGRVQLMRRKGHDRATGGATYTGGGLLWGADSVDREGGESF